VLLMLLSLAHAGILVYFLFRPADCFSAYWATPELQRRDVFIPCQPPDLSHATNPAGVACQAWKEAASASHDIDQLFQAGRSNPLDQILDCLDIPQTDALGFAALRRPSFC
jgi:hypothetical protein